MDKPVASPISAHKPEKAPVPVYSGWLRVFNRWDNAPALLDVNFSVPMDGEAPFDCERAKRWLLDLALDKVLKVPAIAGMKSMTASHFTPEPRGIDPWPWTESSIIIVDGENGRHYAMLRVAKGRVA